MKTISVHVEESDYEGFKSLAARRGRPVAKLIREAMAAYLAAESGEGPSVLDLPAHDGGQILMSWSRSEIYDEMTGR